MAPLSLRFSVLAAALAVFLVLSTAAARRATGRSAVVAGGSFHGVVVHEDATGGWAQVGGGLNRTVYALANYADTLVAAGSAGFVVGANGEVAHGVAYLDGETWVPLGGGVSDSSPYTAFGFALEVGTATVGGAAKEVLYLGGVFLKAGDVDAKNVAMWDGAAWHALSTGLVGTAYAMTTFRRELVVAGEIRQAGGTIVGNIAKWDGTEWTALADGTDSDVFAVATYQDRLFSGGWFSSASGVPGTACLAFWDGAVWQATGSPLTYCFVASFAVDSDLLIVGGSFSLPGERTTTYVAIWNGERLVASATASQFVPGSMALALLATPEGMYAGGTFSSTIDGSDANIIVHGNGTWVPCPTAEGSATEAYAFAHHDL